MLHANTHSNLLQIDIAQPCLLAMFVALRPTGAFPKYHCALPLVVATLQAAVQLIEWLYSLAQSD